MNKRFRLENIKLLTDQQKKEIKKQVEVSERIYNEKTQKAYLKQTGSELAGEPQRKLFLKVAEQICSSAEYEKEGLVPGRRFRADIYLPESRIVIEFDGFEFHKSKDKFQLDRVKRNALVARGFPVMSYYYKQIENDIENVIAEISIAHKLYKNLFENMGVKS